MRKRFALRFRVSMSQRALHVFAANTTWYLLPFFSHFTRLPFRRHTHTHIYVEKGIRVKKIERQKKKKNETKRNTKHWRRHTFLHIKIKWNWNCWKDWSAKLKQLLEVEWAFAQFCNDSEVTGRKIFHTQSVFLSFAKLILLNSSERGEENWCLLFAIIQSRRWVLTKMYDVWAALTVLSLKYDWRGFICFVSLSHLRIEMFMFELHCIALHFLTFDLFLFAYTYFCISMKFACDVLRNGKDCAK